MSVTYYKRFRMEIDLGRLPAGEELPSGYYWVPWDEAICDYHAEVKYRCFMQGMDSIIFPNLGDRLGCEKLMRDISTRRGFLPESTWLIGNGTGYIGTVQGVIMRGSLGMIQNLGVVPELRRKGLGTALLTKSLVGFRNAGIKRAFLEVTADNTFAVRLYRRMGFRRSRTLFKAVSTASS